MALATTLPVQHAIISEDSLPPEKSPVEGANEMGRGDKPATGGDVVSEPPTVKPISSPWVSDVALVKKKDAISGLQYTIAA